MDRQKGSPATASGFSLVELMISLVAGLIVAGAALAFVMSGLRNNAAYVNSARLTQELRNSMGFISDELRRAGYDGNALTYLARRAGATVGASRFAMIELDSPTTSTPCIVYAYDLVPGSSTEAAGTVDPEAGEIRSIRRRTRTVNGVAGIGVIEFAQSTDSHTPACSDDGPDYSTYPATANATTGWTALSDPRVIDITDMRIVRNLGDPGLASTPAVDGVITPASVDVLPMQVRTFDVSLTGSLRENPEVVRGMRNDIKVRADCVRPSAATACTLAPTGT